MKEDEIAEEEVKHVQLSSDESYGASIPVEGAVGCLGDALPVHTMNGKRCHGIMATQFVRWLQGMWRQGVSSGRKE